MFTLFKLLILPQKILQELAAKQKEVIKAHTEAEKLFQEKGFDPSAQKLAEEMKQLLVRLVTHLLSRFQNEL